MSERNRHRFVPSLEQLGGRLNPSSLDPASLMDPAAEPAAGRTVRHRMFAIVDRTQLSDGVVILTASLPGGGADAGGERVVLTGPVGEFESDRPPPTGDGTITFYDLNGSVVAVALTTFDPAAATDGSSGNDSHGVTVLLQRLANPSPPEGTSDNVYAVWLTVGFSHVVPGSNDADAAHRRNRVTPLSADLDLPGAPPIAFPFTADGRDAGATITFHLDTEPERIRGRT